MCLMDISRLGRYWHDIDMYWSTHMHIYIYTHTHYYTFIRFTMEDLTGMVGGCPRNKRVNPTPTNRGKVIRKTLDGRGILFSDKANKPVVVVIRQLGHYGNTCVFTIKLTIFVTSPPVIIRIAKEYCLSTSPFSSSTCSRYPLGKYMTYHALLMQKRER